MADDTTPIAHDFSALSDEELRSEYEAVRTRGNELSGKAEFSSEETTELSELSVKAQALSAEVTSRNERTAAVQAQKDVFSSLAPLPEAVAPAVVPQAVTEPSSVQKSTETVSTPVVPSVAELAVQDRTPAAPARTGDTVTAHVGAPMAGLVDLPAGSVYANNDQIAFALIKNAQSHGRTGGAGTRQTVAQFKRDRGTELTIEDGTDRQSVKDALKFARNERRLEGGSLAKAWQKSLDEGASLTAAAGWCAPSQNDYDLCRNWSSPVGLLDLPTVTVTRGGINYTDEPTFPQIYANAVAVGGGSNFLTEAQVIADTLKTCSEIPCPSFENRRLDVMALCIRVSFLQAAGYPEVVAAWDDGLRAAHEAEMNRLIIADIIARAGAATVIDGFGTTDDSFTSGLLAAVELAAEDIRYQFHMDWNATIEVVLPHWVIPQIRADLSRRTGDTGNLLGVSDAQIGSLFSVRGVRVHWVRGWQDGLITGGALDPTFPGGDATTPFMTALPVTGIQFLAFPAGSVAVARQDVVTLTNVYDAASLAVNEYTSLFAEEGFAPIYPCPGQRLYTVNDLCVGGTTGEAQIRCSAPAA